MTQPRRVEPGMIVLITRRTLRRTRLLRPDPAVNNLFLYLLGFYAQRHGVRIVAPGLLSTHEHIVAQVPDEERLDDFLRDFHRVVALCIKVLRKWEGAVWDHEQTSVVHLRTVDAVIQKIAYVMANPVAATLVHRARLWPGVQVVPRDLGRKVFTATKPRVYLDQNSEQWPEHIELPLALPEGIGVEADSLRDAVARELRALEERARGEAKAKGRRFLGPKRARAASPYGRARGLEAPRKRNPTFAVGRGNAAAFVQAFNELRAFRRAYRSALLAWRAGNHRVVFPAGTLLMRSAFGVRVASG